MPIKWSFFQPGFFFSGFPVQTVSSHTVPKPGHSAPIRVTKTLDILQVTVLVTCKIHPLLRLASRIFVFSIVTCFVLLNCTLASDGGAIYLPVPVFVLLFTPGVQLELQSHFPRFFPSFSLSFWILILFSNTRTVPPSSAWFCRFNRLIISWISKLLLKYQTELNNWNHHAENHFKCSQCWEGDIHSYSPGNLYATTFM